MSIRGRFLFLPALATLLVVPALVQAQFRQPGLKTVGAFESPTGVTAGWSKAGVQLSWKGVAGAAQYLVLRGPAQSTVAQIAVLTPEQIGFLDQANAGPAFYQIVAVSPKGARGPSAVVLYSPPAAAPAPPPPYSSPKTMTATASPLTVALPNTGATALSGRAASVVSPPVITSVAQPPVGSTSARNGETVVVQGTGMVGLTSVVLVKGDYLQGGFKAGGGSYPAGWYSLSAVQHPVTPLNIGPGGFSFIPQVPTPGTLLQSTPYLVIVTKGSLVDTSDVAISMLGALPVRKITSVTQTVIRSGARFDIQGIGLDQVSGGYFGTGVPGSATNPLFNVMNRSATSVQLATTATCNQEGFLELVQPPLAGEAATIYPTPRITVACVANTPSGSIMGSESSANGTVTALPGSSFVIRGTGLKYVTRVLDVNLTAYPFTYAKVGNTEQLNVTMPVARPSGGYGSQFFLENALNNPVVSGMVTGILWVMTPPILTRADPAWAEPGQLVRVQGQQIKYATNPQVWVGGVAAQVVSATVSSVDFRLAPGTTRGPIEVQNEAGKTALTAAFSTQIQTPHPGFFVVSGPSVITSISTPRPTLAYGDILTVQGQNLARLGGICVVSSGQGGVNPGFLALRRGGGAFSGSAQMGSIASNTTMEVTLEYQPVSVAPGPIQLYASSQPVGDMPPSIFACAPNPAPVNWP